MFNHAWFGYDQKVVALYVQATILSLIFEAHFAAKALWKLAYIVIYLSIQIAKDALCAHR